jgi:type II secretory pathway pseudopilin PulG
MLSFAPVAGTLRVPSMCPKGATYVSPRRSPGSDADQKHQSPNGAHYRNRSGLTLVEMLVSLVCVLMLMAAYTQLFSDVGSKVGEARSMIELSTRMRSAAQRLRTDLEAHTCDMKPWQRPEAGAGYFEIIEGPLCDRKGKNGLSSSSSTLYDLTDFPLGDTDDVIMWTIRSKEGSFIGHNGVDASGNPIVVQSEVAEVVWFLRPTLKSDNKTPVDPPTYTLYRRVFLVLPSLGPASVTTVDAHPEQYDISMHKEGSSYVANSLGDLTKRENRVAHDPSAFPFRVNPALLMPFGHEFDVSTGNYQHNTALPTNARYGEDAVLTNVLSFDVQVWDPSAEIKLTSNGTAVLPDDPGYWPPSTSSVSGTTGAYVNLGWNNFAAYSTFPSAPFRTAGRPELPGNASASKLVASNSSPAFNQTWLYYPLSSPNYKQPATFDTWSFSYEMDGINEANPSSPSTADQGTNQIVAIQTGSSDYETSPPYPVPLRGVKIRIRCYEPDSRDVREVTVTESFVPQ